MFISLLRSLKLNERKSSYKYFVPNGTRRLRESRLALASATAPSEPSLTVRANALTRSLTLPVLTPSSSIPQAHHRTGHRGDQFLFGIFGDGEHIGADHCQGSSGFDDFGAGHELCSLRRA
jgi:hypothetical protein